MIISKATLNNLDAIIQLYKEARQYMAENGNAKQWGENYPPIELVEQDIRQGKCYMALDDDCICGIFYFAIEEDKCYNVIKNGQWRNNRLYGVVHRIAVSKDTHNKGIAGKCIAYAVNQCLANGVYDLRMDTHRDNIPMQRFLEKHDFVRCGEVCVEDGGERIAYHKILD